MKNEIFPNLGNKYLHIFKYSKEDISNLWNACNGNGLKNKKQYISNTLSTHITTKYWFKINNQEKDFHWENII